MLFNLAGGLLIQKRRAEKALEASGMNYCIVRPGGMERPGKLCFCAVVQSGSGRASSTGLHNVQF